MKRVIKVAVFAVLFMLVYSTVNGLLETKTTDGNGRMTIYKALPDDTVDVLMIGSSHIGMNVDTRVLWDQYGIAGYTLWSGMQPVVDSYYFLKEALKTQEPDVVVVEVFLSAFLAEDYDYSTVMKSVLALPYGLDKWNAALESAGSWQQAVEMFWGMPVYHERFDELTKDDFLYSSKKENLSLDEINAEVSAIGSDVYPLSLPDFSGIRDTLPLSEQNNTYLRRIAALCRNRNIRLLFLVSPYEATEEGVMRLNTVREIAEEYGADYLNYLTDFAQTGLDASADFFDVGHLNAGGIQKFSSVFGSWLAEHYALPDRRTDEGHIWNTDRAVDSGEALFTLEEQFQGDGVGRSVDTGVKLYENMYGDWTLLTRLDMETFGDDAVYLSCFSEDQTQGNFGLLLRNKADGKLSLKLGDNIEIEVAYDTEQVDLAIVKQSQSYTVFANGEKLADGYELPCSAYDGTLLVGCQELSAGGERFRFSRTHVLNLEVYDSALSDAQILGWSPETLPEMALPLGQDTDAATLVWALPERFTADAENYIQPRYYDTGLKLYEDAGTRFTITADVTPGMTDDGNVFFSCFAEDAAEYRGILLRQTEADCLDLLIGSAYTLKIPCTDGEAVKLAIVKDVSTYAVYVDDALLAEKLELPCSGYDGTLLVGCQLDENGELFRFSHSAVNALAVYGGVLSEDGLRAFDAAETPLPQKRVATEVNYEMEYAFVGNGADRCLDTGILLYDAPAKDWTLDTVLEVSNAASMGVYLSCFSEEEGAYRGLLIRQSEPDSLMVYVGNAASVSIPLTDSDKKLHLLISKAGSSYRICANGAEIGTLESSCDPYDGTLLVGAQVDADGKLFRFSDAAVDSLALSDGALTAEEAVLRSEPVKRNSRF